MNEPTQPTENLQWIKIIKTLMNKAGHNDYNLAELSGISHATINRIVNGKHPHPRIETISRIARSYNLLTSQIVGEVEIDYENDQAVELFFAINNRRKILHRMIDKMPEVRLEHAIKLMQVISDIPMDRRTYQQRMQDEKDAKYRGQNKRVKPDRRGIDFNDINIDDLNDKD